MSVLALLLGAVAVVVVGFVVVTIALACLAAARDEEREDAGVDE